MNHLIVKFVLSVLAVFMIAGPASAEVYKWTDEDGIVYYSDKKPDDQEVTKLEFPVSTYETVSYGTVSAGIGGDQDTNAKPAAVASRKRVVMFSASWCGVCTKAKKYFRRNRIRFTEYDIEKSSKGKRMYKKLGARGVPVILVGKQRMNGFSEAGFERIHR